MANPQTCEMKWEPTTSIGSVAVSQVRGIYSGTTRKRDVLIWTGSAVTSSSGTISAIITTDGTATGPSMFSDIFFASAQHTLASTTPLAGCFAFLRGYTTGLKTAEFFACKGVNVGLGGGNTIVAAPASQTFFVTVIGTSA